MEIKLITVGKVKEKYYRDKIESLIKEINRSSKKSIKLIEVPDESIPENAGDAIMKSIKEKEGKKILAKIDSKDYVTALCIDGKKTDNKMLKELYIKAENKFASSFDLIIGGSIGLSDEVVKRADYKLSVSDMTFPHQLMRVLLLEIICDSLYDC